MGQNYPTTMDVGSVSAVSVSAVLVVALGLVHVRRRRAREARDEAALEEKRARGAHLARSLHPVIDPDICIGSLSCLKACPEGDILGIVDGAAHLVHGDHCIGHGRCAAECPVGAIKLVFGSAERGVDLPEVDAFFESSRPGVHIVGELGGMGLIKNALMQGLQVAERLAEVVSRSAPPVVVVGAGPAGIGTALGLRARNVPFLLLEQGSVGGSVFHYPRRKVAMTERVDLPIVGKFGKSRITKEELLAGWMSILQKARIHVREGVKVTGIQGEDGHFRVEATQGERRAKAAASKVVLAIGRRGTPRKLGVPGEELPKVVYGLADPEQYEGTRVLVVGGGDSALEAAMQIASETRAEVSLSYRGAELARCRDANRKRFGEMVAARRLRALLPSQVKQILPGEVHLDHGGKPLELANDFVIVSIGGEAPTEFLGKVGVSLRRFHGEAMGDDAAGQDAKTTQRRLIAARVRKERRGRNVARVVFAILGVAVLAVLAWVGRDYYLLGRADRLRSPLHASLKAAGPWGHGVGIVATLFMLSNFLYAARKRWKRLGALGKIGSWLDFHVFVGFMSPLVIAFHATFQSNNLIATGTTIALVVVVFTGIVGRFIYGVVPSDGGKEVELSDLLARFERIREDLGHVPSQSDSMRALMARVTAPVKATALMLLFLRMPFEMLGIRLRLLAVRRKLRDRARRAEFRGAVLRLEKLRWQIRFYASLKRLLRGWRAFHASLAVFLVLVIAVHIGLSLYLGYGLLRR
jgi:thioredoxin reductase/Pyruvate/2-oxoacid:ferredoxin oxidoreductase delta subunit